MKNKYQFGCKIHLFFKQNYKILKTRLTAQSDVIQNQLGSTGKNHGKSVTRRDINWKEKNLQVRLWRQQVFKREGNKKLGIIHDGKGI